MQIKNLPIIMLAAGLSERFDTEHRQIHKSMLNLYQDYSIFDFIVEGLINCGVLDFWVILGYKYEKFAHYIKTREFYRLNKIAISVIRADATYLNGPVYTLLSAFSYLSALPNNKFMVIPSDTIFHRSLSSQIYSEYIASEENSCMIFTLSIDEEKQRQYDKWLDFHPHKIDKESVFFQESEDRVVIPLIILSQAFLQFIKNQSNCISGNIWSNLENYYKKTHLVREIQLPYSGDLPPFIDIDNSLIYNKVHNLKANVLEQYKVK
ncbi:MAG: NTP transferase domain-containing protein [Candidatus Lokiarchaeota archaeon]|nr:NTP transferase domain-containing protein [Candidatus Lokiarchaeota archaeon]